MTAFDAAREICKKLHSRGHEAFLVGGCVRDLLLGRESKDYDVTTDALPDEVQAIFPKTIPVGAAFGVIVAVHEGHQIEIATYRADGEYTDARRPDSVSFSRTVEQDIVRRDFTINGLLWMPPLSIESRPALLERLTALELKNKEAFQLYDGEVLVDFVAGREDLENKLIRAIGDPVARFTEDALRMLRAVRFAAQLGFEIEQNTLAAIVRMRENITKVSRERVAAELFKLLTAPFPSMGLAPLFSTGLARFVFTPDFVNCLRLARTLERFELADNPDPLMGLAMLLVDADRGAGNQVLDSLKLASDQYKQVSGALRVIRSGALHRCYQTDDAAIKRLAREAGFKLALNLLEQDSAIGKSFLDSATVERTLEKYRSLTREEIHPKPLVTGQDLIDMGMKPGPEFTSILREIETHQLNGRLKSREEALATFDNEGELAKKPE